MGFSCFAGTQDLEVGMQHVQEPGVLIKFQMSVWVITAIVTLILVTETSFQSIPLD